MSSVCLSLVANLRCTGLRPQQTIGILVPPIVELVAIFPLIYSQREQGRSHYLLISESFFYLILCILDFVSKSTDSIAKSLDTFSVVDRLIGGFSAIPILLYTIFLYVLARRFFIPVIPKRFHSGVKVLLLVLIPTILALIEFGSLIGITYTVVEKPTRELAVRFNLPWQRLYGRSLAPQALPFSSCINSLHSSLHPFVHSGISFKTRHPPLQSQGVNAKRSSEDEVFVVSVGFWQESNSVL